MRPFEVLNGNFIRIQFKEKKAGETFVPYGFISAERDGEESLPYQTMMDTGSQLVMVVMDAAEDLLGKPRDEIISKCHHKIPIGGIGGGSPVEGYAWTADLRLRAATDDAKSMLLPGVTFYAVNARRLLADYFVIFGQKTGFEQRWLKQHNHSEKRYWQLREWK